MRFLQVTTLDAVTTIQEFVTRVCELKDKHRPVTWYRGHSDTAYQLVPTIGRPSRYNGKKITFTEEQEVQLLHRFRRRIYPYVGRILDDWEAILLARHHALPTRILDWSRLPLVALYFAASANQDRDGDVWAMVRFDGSDHNLDVLDLSTKQSSPSPFNFRDALPAKFASDSDAAIKILHPFYNSPRIVSQDGVFTIHSDPKFPMEEYTGVEFADPRLDVEHLIRIPIPSTAKRTLVRELDMFAINRRTVFPDLDGVAGHLREVETMWRGDDDPEAK